MFLCSCNVENVFQQSLVKSGDNIPVGSEKSANVFEDLVRSRQLSLVNFRRGPSATQRYAAVRHQ